MKCQSEEIFTAKLYYCVVFTVLISISHLPGMYVCMSFYARPIFNGNSIFITQLNSWIIFRKSILILNYQWIQSIQWMMLWIIWYKRYFKLSSKASDFHFHNSFHKREHNSWQSMKYSNRVSIEAKLNSLSSV